VEHLLLSPVGSVVLGHPDSRPEDLTASVNVVLGLVEE